MNAQPWRETSIDKYGQHEVPCNMAVNVVHSKEQEHLVMMGNFPPLWYPTQNQARAMHLVKVGSSKSCNNV